MSVLVEIVTAADAAVRNQSLDAFCRPAPLETLLAECAALDRFRRHSGNLYERVRALFFLYAIHRFHVPLKAGASAGGEIPHAGQMLLLKRRFDEAIDLFLGTQAAQGANASLSSALAGGYRSLAFQTLADQVRHSVKSLRGNQWMFRAGHPAELALRIHPALLAGDGLFPILHESTPVRMDLTHSGWSDIFFLGMDFPEGARVLNVSIDLSVRGSGAAGPVPPVEAYLRVIDQPVLRLTSVDLKATVEITTIAEVFDFARDYLGLLKAAVISSGIVPPGMEGASQPLADLLQRLTGKPGHGLEVVSKVNNIPKGSRLAVSTNLLASLIAVCMRATQQIRTLTGPLEESDRRMVAARAILGEWLGGSGGGWQDSGGVWPGMKVIRGVRAAEGDPEFGVSRGCLLPRHEVLTLEQVSAGTRRALQESLVLVHGGMAQDVGPILEMVTEKYLLRSEAEWQGRQQAIATLDAILGHLTAGDVQAVGDATQRNFDGPIQTISPWAGNLYTETLIARVREEFGSAFWGFWMLGGMAGGGMGFIVDPSQKARAQERLQAIMSETRRRLERAVAFAMEPVVYDFAINETGTRAALLDGEAALMPVEYYNLVLPGLVRTDPALLSAARRRELAQFGEALRSHPEFQATTQHLFESLVPRTGEGLTQRRESLHALLAEYGFDRIEHEQIQADLRAGRIGLAQNRLPVSVQIEDVREGDYGDAREGLPDRYRTVGLEALRRGEVAVVSLAGGIGSRWTKGAGVVKALSPFCRFAGRHRTFVELHLAKSRRVSRECGALLPHVITTSYLTHEGTAKYLEAEGNYGYPGELVLSPGKSIGLRMIPAARDLRFAWEEMPQQLLDVQAQKMRESLHGTLIDWARQMGEGSDYTGNDPMQCLHPVGHWYEVPNLLRNGVLAGLLEARPQLRYLMVHNIDTVGADVDAALLGWHIESGATLTFEVITRHIEDTGGGLARVNEHVRLVEGMALPAPEIEARLRFYNTNTNWIEIDGLLREFGLERGQLRDEAAVNEAVRRMAARMPAYITLKDVKKRWGKAQEDIFPVSQFEKLWVDMTALPDLRCAYVAVPRVRGQQLKDVAQLDGWLRDGSAGYVAGLCEWGM